MLLNEIAQKDVRELLSSFMLHLVMEDPQKFGWLSKYLYDVRRASDDAVTYAIETFDAHGMDMVLVGLIATAIATRSIAGTRSTLRAIQDIHHPLTQHPSVSRWHTAAITRDTNDWRNTRKDATNFLNQVRVLLVSINQAQQLKDDPDELTRSLARGVLNQLGLVNS